MYSRENKKALIVSMIRKQAKILRFDISKLTNLSPAGVGIIIDEMAKQGILKQRDKNIKFSKRKGVLLELNPDYGYSVGVEFNAETISSSVLDFTGKEVISLNMQVDKENDKFTIVKKIKEIIHQSIEGSKVPFNKVFGIGIGVPGFLYIEKGISVFYGPIPEWKDVPLKDMLSVEFSCPIYFEKNLSTIALGEKWFGSAKEFDDFVCMVIRGTGVGMGIIADGKIFRGSNENAGEFGHIIVDRSGPKCICGNRGCVEEFASNSAIVRNFQKLNPDLKELTIEKIIDLALSDNENAVEVLREGASALGIAIGMVVNIISPKNIIILGKLSKVSNLILPVIEQTINHKAFLYPKDKSNINIIFSEIKENIGALGAAMIVLENHKGRW